MFYLVRHGKTDYSEKNTKIYQGFGTNLAPLSAAGEAEIKNTARDIRLQCAGIILSSPYTRALQTAAILSKELQIDIAVETDLHEWVANKTYAYYEDDERAERHYQEYLDSSGKYPEGAEKDWEDAASIRARVTAVLSKYRQYNKVIVACHGMLIHALTGRYPAGNGEILEFELD